MTRESSSDVVATTMEIARLVAAARKHGETDAYTGKRNAARVSEGMQLEVTTNANDPSGVWAVSMHDVSKGGVAFWSKKDLKPYTFIYIREFSGRTDRVWVPAQVKHRTVGIRGFLIGASFLLAPSADQPAPDRPQSAPPTGPPNLLPPGWRGPRR
ncbi:MAG: PilZ domain-containing protein [Phycisphaerae bacterium]|jgi:hypothetical protein